MALSVDDLTESVPVEVERASHPRVAVNRTLAERLAVTHRVQYKLSIAQREQPPVLTVEQAELRARGWEQPDDDFIVSSSAIVERDGVLIRNGKRSVTFQEAERAEVERVTRVTDGLPTGVVERIEVTVRWAGALTIGDKLAAGDQDLGTVAEIVDDGTQKPRLLGTAGTPVLLRRQLPTAAQRVRARGMGAYDPSTHLPYDGEVVRDDQLAWLADHGGRALIGEVAAYKTGDPQLRTWVFEKLVIGAPVPTGWEVTQLPAEDVSEKAPFFGRRTPELIRFDTISKLAAAAGIEFGRERRGIRIALSDATRATPARLASVVDALAQSGPRRTDFSASAVALVDPALGPHTCRVPTFALCKLLKPVLYRICEERGLTTTIKSSRKLLRTHATIRDELIAAALAERWLVLANGTGGSAAMVGVRAEPSASPVISVSPDTAAKLSLKNGDRVVAHVPVSDAGQAEAPGLGQVTPLGDTAGWIRDVIDGDRETACERLLAHARAGAFDPCLWHRAALLVGGYPT